MSDDTRSYNVGTSDYSKHRIQPWQVWAEYQLDPFRADIVKRLLRTKTYADKTLYESRLEDLKKIEHIVKYMIELYESNKFPWDKNNGTSNASDNNGEGQSKS
jgi:hypothetical protein